ncbi:nitroreductase [Candidatus Woesearchaeota archaeon CG10_big_fil_rev_8_21_14_0_10_45_16]|nr:MAG: nitroreductase [Candidatus Woesearchaeota archaeon CG10_big_fil_rev_8_21_14_0_10_45_16]
MRTSTYDISPLILDRHSPRAMSGEELTDKDLMPLFEAARWAPSSYNNQPWRFIYAKRGSKQWQTFVSLLTEFNQAWATKAAVLVVTISRKDFEYNSKPSRTHAFDTGAAWENLAIEGCKRGLVVHGMEGFDYDKAQKVLKIPAGYEVMMMIAIGKKGDKKKLPADLQKMEEPNDRKPLKDIIMEGRFKG